MSSGGPAVPQGTWLGFGGDFWGAACPSNYGGEAVSRGPLTPGVGRAGVGNGRRRSQGAVGQTSVFSVGFEGARRLLFGVGHVCFSAGGSSFSGKSFSAPKFQLYGPVSDGGCSSGQLKHGSAGKAHLRHTEILLVAVSTSDEEERGPTVRERRIEK